MASVKDFYKRKLLAAKDVGSKTIRGTITDVYPETPTGKDSDGKPKLVIELDDGESRIQLNKTNAIQLAKESGDDFDEWKGKKITVKTAPATMNGAACLTLVIHFDKK